MASLHDQNHDKRGFIRVDFRCRAQIFSGRESEASECLQVSEGGMMVNTKLKLKQDDNITVHFAVKGTNLRARCEVVYVMPTETAGINKVGLKFVSLFQEYRTILRELSA